MGKVRLNKGRKIDEKLLGHFIRSWKDNIRKRIVYDKNEVNDMSKCVCCHKVEVTWPLVCDECTDHESQAELARKYFGKDMVCKSCGMIYDGGQYCTYCGDVDPLDEEGEKNDE